MGHRLPKSHPLHSSGEETSALQDDRSLFRSARDAADFGIISRRTLLGAATGAMAWVSVLESPAMAEKRGGRKGYAVQSIVDRDQLLGGVLEFDEGHRSDTLSAAWGEPKSLWQWRAAGRGRGANLNNTPVEFADKRGGEVQTRIDHRGIRPGLKSPFDRRERYDPSADAAQRFSRYERDNAEAVRRILLMSKIGFESELAPRPDTRFVVTTRPTPVWCNRVGEVEDGPVTVLPAWRPLTYQGRISNSVLIDHPAAARAAGNGRLATFVEARHLVALDTQKRVFAYASRLTEDHRPNKGCLRTQQARDACDK